LGNVTIIRKLSYCLSYFWKTDSSSKIIKGVINNNFLAFRILKRLVTNPIREDQTSKLDYLKIQEDKAWAKAVIPDFDIAMTTSNSNKRERSMETAQPASKRARVNNRGTWSRYFAEM